MDTKTIVTIIKDEVHRIFPFCKCNYIEQFPPYWPCTMEVEFFYGKQYMIIEIDIDLNRSIKENVLTIINEIASRILEGE